MDKVTKIMCLASVFCLLSLFFRTELVAQNKKIEPKKTQQTEQNGYPKLAYLEKLLAKEVVFISDSFNIPTTYIALGMATLLMKDTCEEKEMQGYKLLDQLANLTEEKLKNEIITTENKQVRGILKMLGYHSYFIAVPVSDSEKLVHYVKQGKFGYILQRGYDRGIYKYVALLISSFFVSIWFFYKRRNRISKQNSSQ